MSALTLAQAKSHLNITGAAHDAKLQGTIDEAESAIAEKCGPLEPTATTERVAGGVPFLVLSEAPAISLTSVTPYQGAALTIGDLYLDPKTAIVTQDSGAYFSARFYTVVYSAGRTTLHPDLVLAVKELVRHLWMPQRGPTQRPGSAPSEGAANTIPGAAYLLPFRVSELISEHLTKALA